MVFLNRPDKMLRLTFFLAAILIAVQVSLSAPRPQTDGWVPFTKSAQRKIPVFSPLCGSDGETYPNQYELDCHNKEQQANNRPLVTVVKDTPCDDLVFELPK